MTATTVPDVIDAILAMVAAAAPDVQVTDGLPVERAEDLYIAILGAQQTKDYAEIGRGGGSSQRESIDVHGEVRAYSGSSDPSGVRRDAYNLLGILDTALRGNLSLGLGSLGVLSAVLTGADLSEQAPGPNGGRIVGITFTITVNAYLGRATP